MDLPVALLAFGARLSPGLSELKRLHEEAGGVSAALKSADESGLCEVVVCEDAGIDEVFDVFQDSTYAGRIAIFHYGGHADGLTLLFESASGKPEVAHGKGLAAFLAEQPGLQLVFLNGCATQAQVDDLLSAGVPAVIATSTRISDSLAADFAKRFYTGLAGGASIESAFRSAQADIFTKRSAMPSDAWRLFPERIPEDVASWNLRDASRNYLFGLELPDDIDLPDSPYRYLEWYGREHARVFFGRSREIRELYELVTKGEDQIILLHGQSGVGKSSLLAAGLVPYLEEEFTVVYSRRDPKLGLLRTLTSRLAAIAGGNSSEPDSDTQEVKSLDGSLQLWRLAEEKTSKPLLVILDQVEEAVTRSTSQQAASPDESSESHASTPSTTDEQHADELRSFLHAFRNALDTYLHNTEGRLILSFRKEWFSEVKAVLESNEIDLGFKDMFLQRLDQRGIEEIVDGPALREGLRAKYHLTIEPGLATTIAHDLIRDWESPVAPTLQILLSEMWRDASSASGTEQPRFTQELYREHKGSLSEFLDRQLHDLRDEMPEAVNSGLALDILAYHTSPDGLAEERNRADVFETYSHQQAVIADLLRRLQNLYLLVEPAHNQDGQLASTRLAHDTLAPLVRKLADFSDLPGQRARRTLVNRAVDWRDSRTSEPLDDFDLRIVEDGQSGMRQWTLDETRLVEASKIRRQERIEEQKRVQREIEDNQRKQLEAANALASEQAQRADEQEKSARRLRRRSRIIMSIAIVAVMAGIIAGLSFLQAQSEQRRADQNATEANLQAQTAQNAQLTAEANAAEAQKQRDNAEVERKRADENALKAENEAQAAQSAAQAQATAAAIAKVNQLEAERQATLARIRELSALSESAETNDVSLLLAVEAVNMSLESPREIDSSASLLAEQAIRNALEQPTSQLLSNGNKNIYTVAFSQDSRWLFLGGLDGFARLMDLGNVKSEPQNLSGHSRSITDAVFFSTEADIHSATDSSTLLVTASNDGTIGFWPVDDLISSPQFFPTEHESWIVLALSDDNQLMASGDTSGTIELWDLRQPGHVERIIRNDGDINGSIVKLGFSADNHWLIVLYDDNSYRKAHLIDLWNSTSEIVVLDHQTGFVLNNFTNELYTANPDGGFNIWDLDYLTLDPQYAEYAYGRTESISLSPSGEDLLTVSSGGVGPRIWHLGDRSQQPIVLQSPYSDVRLPTYSTDGRKIFAISPDGGVLIWDVAKPDDSPVVLETASGASTNLEVSGDGKWLVSVAETNGIAHLWSIRALSGEPRILNKLAAGSRYISNIYIGRGQTQTEDGSLTRIGVKDISFSPNGEWLASVRADPVIQIWSVENTSLPLHTIDENTGRPSRITFSGDSKWVAIGSDDHKIRLIDTRDMVSFSKILVGHMKSVTSLSFSPDNLWLASAAHDNTGDLVDVSPRIWNMTEDGVQGLALVGHSDQVYDVSFSRDGKSLASGGRDALVRLWSVENPRNPTVILPGHTRWVNSLSFSYDGRWLASASDTTLLVWDLAHIHDPPLAYVQNAPSFSVMKFGKSNNWLAVGGWNDVLLWKVTDRLEGPVFLRGHVGRVTDLDFSPDGQRLATSGDDGSVRIWNLTNPEAPPVKLIEEAPVNTIAFNFDGSLVAAGYDDGTIRLWRMQLSELVELACGYLGRSFTDSEWARYFPREEYRKTCYRE